MRRKVRAFLEELRSRGLVPETIRRWRETLGLLARCAFRAEEFRRRISRGPVLGRSQLLQARRFFRVVGREEEAEKIPPPPPSHPPPRRAPSRDEVELILAALSEKGRERMALRNRTMGELLYSSGIRACELVRLTLADVDFEKRVLRIHGKGGRERIAPFGSSADRWMREYLSEARPGFRVRGEELFTARSGRALSPLSIQKTFRAARRLAGLGPALTPHAFRRAAATHCLEAGMNLREVQELLGHADLQTTVRYTAVDFIELRKVIERCHPRGKMSISAGRRP